MTATLAHPLEPGPQDFCASHLPWRIDVADASRTRTDVVDLDGPWFVDCRGSAMVGHRQGREIDETAGDYLALLMVDDGVEIFTQEGRESVVGPGAALLWDGVRAAACFSPATLVKRTIFFPRAVLGPAVRQIGGDPRMQVITSAPHLGLLRSWLTASRGDETTIATSGTVGSVALDLVVAGLAESRGVSASTRDALLIRVKKHLNDHLHDPDLTLGDAARACAISLRYLHLLFADTGETATDYLRGRRLERARLLLLSSSHPVTRVALACGFGSASAFSRAFRAHVGTSPSDHRRASALSP